MKIPNRIVGFLNIKSEQKPFEFDKELYELHLYHATKEEASRHLFDALESMDVNLKEHKWVDRITLCGETAEGYLAFFSTSNLPSIYNGYLTYHIDWYYLTDVHSGYMEELCFSGSEINYFYDPSRTFKPNISFQDSNSTKIEKISIDSVQQDDLDCGTYKFKTVDVKVTCSAYATLHFNSEVPFDASSYLRLNFSKKICLEDMVELAWSVKLFLKYISYRTNITLDPIKSYLTNEDGVKSNCGILVFRENIEEESNAKIKQRIIKAEYLNVHIAKVLETIYNKKISFEHLCRSIEDMRHYPTSRIIMILTAFEREFRNIYGQDVRRSDSYKQIKNEVVKVLDEYLNKFTGKKRRYIKSLKKGILSSDSSYGDNLKYALVDCRDIMQPFVLRRYSGTYDDIIEEVSISINELRNGVAHCRLDLELEARHLTDIKFVEEMLYVIRFKYFGMDHKNIQKIINELFNENLVI